MKIYKDFSLKKNNTFRIDVTAKYFAAAKSKNELINIIKSNNENLPIMALGDGANILFTENVKAFVIKILIKGIKIINESDEFVVLEIGAGENWDHLVRFAVGNGWGGIENMALIPGTVGAAAAQNIAAYGQNLVDVFISLEALDLENKAIKTFDKNACKFAYRESIFKKKLFGKFIITKVRIKLSKKIELSTGYFETGKTYTTHVSLMSELEAYGKPPYSLKDVYDAVVRIRTKKLPDPKIIGTAGSFFKNPVVRTEKYKELKKQDSSLQCYPVDRLQYVSENDSDIISDGYVKIPAGRLLDNLGWKGRKIGNVGTFANQALAVVNYGATGEEVLDFTQKMADDVYKNYGIKLEREVQLVNF